MKQLIGLILLLDLLLALLTACGSAGTGSSGATGTSSTGSPGSRTNSGTNTGNNSNSSTTGNSHTGTPNAAATPGAAATATVIVATPGSISTTQSVNPVQISITDKTITSSLKTFSPQKTYTFIIANQSHSPQDFIIGQHTPQTQPVRGALLTLPSNQLPAGATVHFAYKFPANTANRNLEFTNHLAGPEGSGIQLPINVQ